MAKDTTPIYESLELAVYGPNGLYHQINDFAWSSVNGQSAEAPAVEGDQEAGSRISVAAIRTILPIEGQTLALTGKIEGGYSALIGKNINLIDAGGWTTRLLLPGRLPFSLQHAVTTRSGGAEETLSGPGGYLVNSTYINGQARNISKYVVEDHRTKRPKPMLDSRQQALRFRGRYLDVLSSIVAALPAEMMR